MNLPKMNYKALVREGIILAGFAVVLAFAVNTLSPKGIPLVGQWDKSAGVVMARPLPPTEKEREIELPVAQKLFEQKVVFVDARATEEYEEGHIEGAVSFPVMESLQKMNEFHKLYPESTAIVTYCNGRECSDSHDLAENLERAGYFNIRIFIDGFPAWDEAKLPVVKKP